MGHDLADDRLGAVEMIAKLSDRHRPRKRQVL
jgi:hypothetical protein